MICCLSSGDMYLFWGVINSTSLLLLLDFFFETLVILSAILLPTKSPAASAFFLETLVILSAILLPIKSSVASAVFCIALLEAVFIATVADF